VSPVYRLEHGMHCITSLNGSQPNCTMFGRLLGWYTVLFRWLLPCYGIFQVQNSLCVQGLRSPILAALQHGTRVVGVRQTAALSRGRHLYSAGRPSRWALAHILVHVWLRTSHHELHKNWLGCTVIAKFHYAIWFEAGWKLVADQLRTCVRRASN